MVGVQYCNIFTYQYFWQHTLMNVAFRSLAELVANRFEETAEPLKFFACAIQSNETFWGCRATVVTYLRMESHRGYYIDTFASYLQSMFDAHWLW